MRRNGGATIPIAGVLGGLGVGTPLAFIEVDECGVTVGLRSRFLEVFVLFGLGLRGRRPANDSVAWSASWESIDSVKVARRSLVVMSARHGSCRFGTLRRSPIRELESALRGQEATLEPVRTTIHYAWARRPPTD